MADVIDPWIDSSRWAFDEGLGPPLISVFAISRIFPVGKNGQSLFPGLQPERFVIREDGQVFESFSDAGSPSNGERFYFAGTIDCRTGEGKQLLESPLDDLRHLELAGTVQPSMSAEPDDSVDNASDTPERHSSDPDPETEDGSGVIVGVADFGCAFAHRNFRLDNGETRLLYLMDQNTGKEFSSTQINRSLAKPGSYKALGYDPHAKHFMSQMTRRLVDSEFRGCEARFLDRTGTHGTHVLDIAAGNGGNGLGTGVKGVASGASLIFVQVKLRKDNRRLDVLRTADVLDAISYIIFKAQISGMPVVVNVSLSLNSGPHDGSQIFDAALEALLNQPGRAVVFPAGNYREMQMHATGWVARNRPRTLSWRLYMGDKSRNEVQIWYDGTDEPLDATLTRTSRAEPFDPIAVAERERKPIEAEETRGMIWGSVDDPANKSRKLLIKLDPTISSAPIGERWEIQLSTKSANPVSFHAWVERDDQGQSGFEQEDSDHSYTLGAFACGARSITVGAYYRASFNEKVRDFSSAGPTRDGRRKPELIAPGFKVWAAKSQNRVGADGFHAASDNGPVAKSGTSMAAPYVSGVVALLLQKKANATIEEIRSALMESTTPVENAGVWDSRTGYGRVDVKGALARL